jgi:hypothetical protein
MVDIGAIFNISLNPALKKLKKTILNDTGDNTCIGRNSKIYLDLLVITPTAASDRDSKTWRGCGRV